jgi:REP element-mobilizing transposase RayT
MSTHQQLLYHIVFSTKNRQRSLTDGFREKVFAYMAGICKELGGFALIVGGYYDHAHLLIRIPAKISVADFVGKLKANTSKHINDTSGLLRKFGWQDGYGAFTVSVSNKDRVYRYIQNQMEHHQLQSFDDEYLGLLAKHEVEYDPQYVFD